MTGYMAREFFQTSPLLVLPIIALILFIVVFLFVFVRTMRMHGVDEAARLPLHDDFLPLADDYPPLEDDHG